MKKVVQIKGASQSFKLFSILGYYTPTNVREFGILAVLVFIY